MSGYIFTGGSQYTTDVIMGPTHNRFCRVWFTADEGLAGSADINAGVIAASLLATLRAASSGHSQPLDIQTTCMTISGIENGFVSMLRAGNRQDKA